MPRGRPRKNPLAENEIIELPAAPTAPPPEIAAPSIPAGGVTVVKNRLHQEWTQTVPAAAAPAQSHAYPPDYEGGGDVEVVTVADEPEEDIDQEEGILSSFDFSGESLAVTVWELPKFGKDRDCSPRAERILRGSIDIPNSIKDGEGLIDLLQKTYAKPRETNYWFQPVLRKNNKIASKLPVICVSPLEASTEVSPTPGQGGAFLPAALPAPAPANPVDQLKQTLELVKQVNQLVAPVAEKRQAEASQALVPAGELTPDSAFLTLIKQDADTLAALRKKFLGPLMESDGGGSSGGWESVLTAAMPFIGPIFMQMMQARQQPAAPGQQPTAPPAPALPVEPPTIDEQFFQTLYIMAVQNRPGADWLAFVDQMIQAETRIEIHMDAICEYRSGAEIARFVRRNAHQPEVLPPTNPVIENWFVQLAETWRLDRDQAEPAGEGEAEPAQVIELPSRAGDPA